MTKFRQFDHHAFYEFCKAHGACCFISEQTMPEGFECVLETEKTESLRAASQYEDRRRRKRTERLFRVRG